MRGRYYLALACVTGALCCLSVQLPACDFKSNNGIVLLESSRERMLDADNCFARERELILQRHKKYSTFKSSDKSLQKVVGLGLSGGGIKSSAFQLGLLSGLHKTGLLNEIDYTASVSGGSWANGAFIATSQSDDEFFRCLDENVTQTPPSACQAYQRLLPDNQNDFVGSRDWQLQVVDFFLNGEDVKLETLRNESHRLVKKPFPVFMLTHSNTLNEKKSLKNFPFEITPLQIGTVADCNTDEVTCGLLRKKLRPMHWNNQPEQGFVIELDRVKGLDTVIKKYSKNAQDELALSHAMWSSSALFAKVLSMHLHLSVDGKKITGVRKKYVLSDGGKSDNLGLVPLVERRADLIILSQAAGDSKLKFADLTRSVGQVDKLFGMKIDMDKLISPHQAKGTNPPFVTRSCLKNANTPLADVWLIKPTTVNIDGFYTYLKGQDKYKHILTFLQKHEMDKTKQRRFPLNPTIKFKYDKRLIYAYYLLGEYIGREKLSPSLKTWLTEGPSCVSAGPT